MKNFTFKRPCSLALDGRLFGKFAVAAYVAAFAPVQGGDLSTVGSAQAQAGTFFGAVPAENVTRHYYIAAEPINWNFIPLRADPTCSLTGAVQRMRIPQALLQHPVSLKLRYFQYTDDGFDIRALQPERLGILGPVLRGVVGEYLAVTFLNRTDRPLSIHPHGVKYDKDSEGAAYLPSPGRGGSVAPGARFTYVWKFDESSGPRPEEPSSKAWLYHSHVMAEEEINLGLFGFIVVTDPARGRPDGTPNDIDREMAVFLKTFDESHYDSEEDEGAPETGPLNARTHEKRLLALSSSVQGLKRREEGERHTVNGLSYANLPGFEMCENERVRWYLFSLGSERDVHSAHWHGARLVENGVRQTDVVELIPGSMKIADMVAENPGTWLLQCHVGEHMTHGMFCTFLVAPTNDTSRILSSPFFSSPSPPESIRVKTAEKAQLRDGTGSRWMLKIAGEFWVSRALRFEGAIVQVRYQRQSIAFRLNSGGAAEENGSRFELRPTRAANGMLGIQLGFNLNFVLDPTTLDSDISSSTKNDLTIELDGRVLSGHLLF